MSAYTHIIRWGWIESLNALNDVIRCGGDERFQGLTSAEQIISINDADEVGGFNVLWRVREWKDGGQYDNQSV